MAMNVHGQPPLNMIDGHSPCQFCSPTGPQSFIPTWACRLSVAGDPFRGFERCAMSEVAPRSGGELLCALPWPEDRDPEGAQAGQGLALGSHP